jgi:hypothetical protein
MFIGVLSSGNVKASPPLPLSLLSLPLSLIFLYEYLTLSRLELLPPQPASIELKNFGTFLIGRTFFTVEED